MDITLWSIQSEEAWNLAQQRGVLRGDGRRIWRYFRPAYRWMMGQMAQRLNRPIAHYPVWCWPTRPDLRRTGHLASGTSGVLLEIVLNQSQVVFSDFEDWHYVLNGWALCQGEDEVDIDHFDTHPSWTQIFDLSPDTDPAIQATVTEIPIGAIRSVKRFTAR